MTFFKSELWRENRKPILIGVALGLPLGLFCAWVIWETLKMMVATR